MPPHVFSPGRKTFICVTHQFTLQFFPCLTLFFICSPAVAQFLPCEDVPRYIFFPPKHSGTVKQLLTK
ncbi:hypothetical protein ZHAS_00020354 [Anopheles sinensis]|uniref:Uncharacterized protein n=1 Tax=Anopheles sinensis TaxID=74873 RepID=A0A084WPF3_ANOSI|nr:hypothetical protein ZHAS_00020354 [Anopheles sinensis]